VSRSRSRRIHVPATSNRKRKPAQTPPKSEPAKEAPPRRHKLWRAWQIAWGIFGPPVALTGLFFLLRPQVTIEPSVNLDPGQPLATQFLISNRGHVPIYNVRFGWTIGGSGAHIGHLRPANLMPVAKCLTRNRVGSVKRAPLA
jgi:hypothetical protein